MQCLCLLISQSSDQLLIGMQASLSGLRVWPFYWAHQFRQLVAAVSVGSELQLLASLSESAGDAVHNPAVLGADAVHGPAVLPGGRNVRFWMDSAPRTQE